MSYDDVHTVSFTSTLENLFKTSACLHGFEFGFCREDAVAALNDAIDNREEGIMIKDPNSPYQPNMRKGGWYKVKPDYLSKHNKDVC